MTCSFVNSCGRTPPPNADEVDREWNELKKALSEQETDAGQFHGRNQADGAAAPGRHRRTGAVAPPTSTPVSARPNCLPITRPTRSSLTRLSSRPATSSNRWARIPRSETRPGSSSKCCVRKLSAGGCHSTPPPGNIPIASTARTTAATSAVPLQVRRPGTGRQGGVCHESRRRRHRVERGRPAPAQGHRPHRRAAVHFSARAKRSARPTLRTWDSIKES